MKLLTERIVLSNKKRNLRKYSVVFFKAFKKKKTYLANVVFVVVLICEANNRANN